MYYVIKKISISPTQRFVGFIVSKYIATKNNDTVIFEFDKDSKVQRKWVKKKDIILLTQDKNNFIEILNRFRAVESEQLELIEDVKKQLEDTVELSAVNIDKDIEEYLNCKTSDDFIY